MVAGQNSIWKPLLWVILKFAWLAGYFRQDLWRFKKCSKIQMVVKRFKWFFMSALFAIYLKSLTKSIPPHKKASFFPSPLLQSTVDNHEPSAFYSLGQLHAHVLRCGSARSLRGNSGARLLGGSARCLLNGSFSSLSGSPINQFAQDRVARSPISVSLPCYL